MKNQDIFHKIAKTKHPIDSTDREILPMDISGHCLPLIDQTFLLPIEEMSYEEQKEKFQKNLQKLRGYYRPFMKNYLQAVPEHTEKIYFREFSFRYAEKEECFTERNVLKKSWEKVTIPDYRGPAGANGKWDAYYKKIFSCPEEWKEKVNSGYRIIIDFQCVDYIAQIFMNGNFAGGQEGLFAPFAFDITRLIREENEALWLLPEREMELDFDGTAIRTKPCGDLFFAAADGVYEDYPISMVYNNKKGYIDSTAAFTVDTRLPGETLIYTYEKQGFAGSYGAKQHLPFVKSCVVGKGRLLLCSLARNGRAGYNGGLDRLFLAFLNSLAKSCKPLEE